MKLFELIGFRNSGNTCKNCVYFQNDPARIEKTYAGLNIMSSGYAAVRDRDGLCSFNNIYLSAGDACVNFTNSSLNVDAKA